MRGETRDSYVASQDHFEGTWETLSAELPREVDGAVATAEEWFERAVDTLGTAESFVFGDRAVLDQQVLGWLDESHSVMTQAVTMPRGVSDREFVTLAHIDYESCTFTSKSLEGRTATSLAATVGKGGLVRGRAMVYGFRIEPPSDPQSGCAFVVFEHFNPLGGGPPRAINLDLVGRARAKGIRGMARALGSHVLCPVQRHASSLSGKQGGCGVTFRENLTYRSELLSMLLDRISREQHRVACSVNIFDMGGTSTEHRRLFPYIKVTSAIGDAISVTSSVILVSAVNSVVATLWGGARRLLSETTRASVCALSGCARIA